MGACRGEVAIALVRTSGDAWLQQIYALGCGGGRCGWSGKNTHSRPPEDLRGTQEAGRIYRSLRQGRDLGRRTLASLQESHRQGCGQDGKETGRDRRSLTLVARGSWRIFNVMRTRRSQSSSDPVSSGHPPAFVGAGHVPVLLHEAVDSLSLKPDDVVVDATLGGAGHAGAIAATLGKKGVLIGFDLDTDAISRAKKVLEGARPDVHLILGNFRHLGKELERL